jgi:hypothetical protein
MQSLKVSHAARPIVKDGKMMWNEMVNANWSRDRSNAVTAIEASYYQRRAIRR